ncbi:SDR family oxidoreductase [Compostibacter hankyongensis]|uniref:SDR family oxidoreductase n=1 Tax=Compostibacter hankyongensis TaxID=1007089 RepID=A0ABP8FPC1_9BACT
MSADFKDKVVVITGGSSGIGEALVKAFLQEGAKVAACGRQEAALAALQSSHAGSDLLTRRADVSRETDCRDFIDAVVHAWGGIDILINNAGGSMRGLFGDMKDMAVLKKLMDSNFWGTVYCTHYALPHIRERRGVIAGISSIAGYRGLPGRTGYSASKFAMQGFLETLRTELLHTGVHVMWVCPGFTASNIRNTALNEKGEVQGETPLQEDRLMTAAEVAAATLGAIRKRKRTLVLTGQGKLTVWLNRLIPGMMDRIVYNHFKKEPGSPLK